MTQLVDWLERADWSRRSVEFGALREERDRGRMALVAMEFTPPRVAGVVFERLWQLWLALPKHPNVLEAIGDNRDSQRLLRYAAIDWKHPPITLSGDPQGAARLASWGVDLVRTCEFLSSFVQKDVLGWFACPIVRIDLEGEARVAFVPAKGDAALTARLPPEAVDQWPRCDDRGLVFVIGRLLRDLVMLEDETRTLPVCQTIDRCLAEDPANRFATLKELLEEFVAAGGRRKPPHGTRPPRKVWNCVETGLGYLAMGQPKKAVTWFEQAVEQERISRTTPTAKQGPNAQTLALRECRDDIIKRAQDVDMLAWTDAEARGSQFEQQRRFYEALELYRRVRIEGADMPALELSIARCSFQLGDFGVASDYAHRVLQRVPGRQAALELRAFAQLRTRRYAEALESANSWLTVAPDDGRAHLARGKSLLALGRVVDARDSFERASVRGPQLLEAMLLRRELDRSLKDVRAAAGTANAASIDLPAHLAELRDVLVGGRTSDAIEMLRRPEYVSDAVAQLLLASHLSFERLHSDALAIYDRVLTLGDEQRHAALLGKGDALLASGRPEESLRLFDQVSAERKDLTESIDGRARALKQLGRNEEADEAFKQYVAIAGQRSELRVRSR